MRRVVKADGLEGHPREMMGLEFGEELEFISGMLRARVRDVLEVARELVLRICSHFCRHCGRIEDLGHREMVVSILVFSQTYIVTV